MNRKRTVLLAILALVLCVAAVALGALALSKMLPPSCTPGTIGCIPGLRETLKAMPTETPGATPTQIPCTWQGHFCIPDPTPTPDRHEAGQLRPWAPGYPNDVHA